MCHVCCRYNEVKALRDSGEVLTEDQKHSAFKRYKSYKSGKNTDGISFKQITNVQLGMKTPLTFQQIKPLMKAFRQELNNLESPVKEVTGCTYCVSVGCQLKFRCCGMKAVPSEGQRLNLKHEPFASSGKISITKPVGMQPEEVACMVEDFCQHDRELANFLCVEPALRLILVCSITKLNHLSLWFSNNTHYRFYASSVCMFYDLDDHR